MVLYFNRKIKAKTKRRFASADVARKERANKAAWDEMMAKYPPLGAKTKKQPLGDYLAEELRKRKRTPDLPSRGAIDPVIRAGERSKPLTAEMQAREDAAQKEIERKRKRVAPLYNKGGYQFVTDDTDLTTLGRKV